jgi:hypothetical protein
MQQLRYIKGVYQREDIKIEEWYIQRPKQYLSEAEMETFVQNYTQTLIDLFRRLWQQGEELQEFESTLELLCKDRSPGDAR